MNERQTSGQPAASTLGQKVDARFGEEPVAVCDAADVNLPGTINAFWRPNADTFHLAERLHTRCDVAWPDIDLLLAAASPASTV